MKYRMYDDEYYNKSSNKLYTKYFTDALLTATANIAADSSGP